MEANARRVVVIGGGVGGAGVAALLARKGHRVTLFEKNQFVGGKASSFIREGFTCDLGVHMFGNSEKGPLGRIAKIVGAGIEWKHSHPLGLFATGDRKFPLPQEMDRLGNSYLLSRSLKVGPSQLFGTARFMNSLITATDEQAEALDHVSFREFLLRYTDDIEIHRFMTGMSALAFVLPYQEASAGEFIKVYSEGLRNASIGYPVGGAQKICNAYSAALEELGGKVMLGNQVKEIVVDGGKVAGVVADNSYEADVVVSNAGIKRTVELAGAGSFPAEYLEYVGSLRESYAGISIKYALSKKVLDFNMLRFIPEKDPGDVFDFLHDMEKVPDDPDIFMPVPSNFDPALAPDGCQLAIAGTVAPRELDRKNQCKAILDNLDAKVKYFCPEIEKYEMFQVRSLTRDIAEVTGRETGDCIGIAQSFDQVGGRKLENSTPVEGLFLVGTDAGARGIGTEEAANSALACSRAIG